MDIFQVRDILLSYKGQNLTEKYSEYGYNTPSNKGKFGLLIENILGLNNNSIQEPDFGDFELKCIPLKKLKNGKLTFKETVAITMINPDNIINTSFSESHLYNKLKKVLFVTYINDTIYDVHIFELNGTIYDEVKNDYDNIRKSIIMVGFPSLSSSMGKYIQPRTKGAGHGSISRAFYGRVSFLSEIIKI